MDMSGSWLAELVPDQKHVRALRIVLLTALVYPPYLLTCYMAAKGFYAHEIFSSIVGLVVPILFMALVFTPLLLLFMALVWGGILGLFDAWLESIWRADPGPPGVPWRRRLQEFAVILGLNLILLAGALYVLATGSVEDLTEPFAALLIASLGLGVCLVVAGRAAPAERMTLLAFALLLATFVPLFGQHYTTALVETILTQFRLGGVMVTVVPDDRTPRSEPTTDGRLYGRLVFLSSSHLYVEADCPRKLMIVPRRDSLRLEFAAIRTAGLKEFRCEGQAPVKGRSRRPGERPPTFAWWSPP
jgi:hypothetical protein